MRQGALFASSSNTSPLFAISVRYQQAVVTSLATYSWRNAAVKSDGSLWTWYLQQSTPVKVGEEYAYVAVSSYATLAIKKDSSLWTWGGNSEGILGNGTTDSNAEPKQVGIGFVKVVVKGEGTMAGDSAEALKIDGSLWIWGARSLAQPNAWGPPLAPRMIGTGFVDLAGDTSGISLGLKADGSIWTWHRNMSDDPFVPVKIAEGYVAIATSLNAVYGLKSDGSLWNWGTSAPNNAGSSPTVHCGSAAMERWVSSATDTPATVHSDRLTQILPRHGPTAHAPSSERRTEACGVQVTATWVMANSRATSTRLSK
jgi:hypothetical protein